MQLYLNDKVSSVTTPVQVLKGFEKIELEAGESKRVGFTIAFEDLSLWNREMIKVVEPGTFEIMLGSSSEDIRLRDEFIVL